MVAAGFESRSTFGDLVAVGDEGVGEGAIVRKTTPMLTASSVIGTSTFVPLK